MYKNLLHSLIFPVFDSFIMKGNEMLITLSAQNRIPSSVIRSEIENHQQAEKGQQVRRAPSFSGPLMLPNRASANSLSAPIKSSGGSQFIHLISLQFIDTSLLGS